MCTLACKDYTFELTVHCHPRHPPPLPPLWACLQCMASKCGGEILSCVTDATCKTALDCLQGCAFNDQVGIQAGIQAGSG